MNTGPERKSIKPLINRNQIKTRILYIIFQNSIYLRQTLERGGSNLRVMATTSDSQYVERITKRKRKETVYSSSDYLLMPRPPPKPDKPCHRTRLAQRKLELAEKFPYLESIKPNAEIISILKAHRDEYRSSHSRFGSSKALKKVRLHRWGGRHAGLYSYGRDSGLPGFPPMDMSQGFGDTVTTDAARYVGLHSPGDSALFILLLEEEEIFMTLVRAGFHIRFQCIMIAAPPGRPTDLATRLFLKKLNVDLKLPVLALGSLSPSWFDHLHVYRNGLSTDKANLGVPDIHLLGLTQADLQIFGDHIHQAYFGKNMELEDLKKMELMLEDNPSFKHIFDLSLLKEVADPNGMNDFCLMHAYLPLKLQEKDWYPMGK